MSLSNDIAQQQDMKTCFICEFQISNKNTTTVEKEGMFFHKNCYEQQFSLQDIDNNQSSNQFANQHPNKTPLDEEYENNSKPETKTNTKFIEEDICPLVQINRTNKTQHNLPDDLPDLTDFTDLLPSEKLFSLTPEVEKRKPNTTLGPEIIIKNDTKKVTFDKGLKIPAAELEYESSSEELDYFDKNKKIKQTETFPKQSKPFPKHPNVFNEINICLECGNSIDFSKPNSFMPFNNTVADLIDYSDNMLDNFNKLGENVAQNLGEVKDYAINFYIHINCANVLQCKKSQYLNQSKNNNIAQGKQNEIPTEKFDEVMKIMGVQKGEEISTTLKNLSIQMTNMNNVLCRVEQRMKQQQNLAEIDEQNRKELFGISSNTQEKVAKNINKQVTNDQIRESVMQLAVLMLKFNEGLMNFEKTINNQEFMNARRHEIIKEYFEKIATEEENNKKRNDIILDLIQDVESTLSAKIFELSEKIGILTSVPKTQ